MPRRDWGAGVLAGVCLGLLVAALHQALIAVSVLTIGHLPGEGATGSRVAYLVAIACFLIATSTLTVRAARGTAGRLDASIVLAAAAFVAARFYTFDPYYAPALRRMSDGGVVSGSWIVALVSAAIVISILGLRAPRTAGALAAILSLLLAATSLFEGAGH